MNSNVKKILVLASNPKGTSVLALEREIRDIREGFKRADNRDRFQIETRGAVRPEDLRRAMLEVKPHIVHFCGHGTGSQGLVLEDDDGREDLASTEALADLFSLISDRVECVLLNACYAQVQAKAISEHINYVIGMSHEILDNAAIAFTVGFYDALGAGETIESAYKWGCNAIQFKMSGRSIPRKAEVVGATPKVEIAEHLKPVLNKKENLNSLIISPADSNNSYSNWNYLSSLKGHSDWVRSLAFSSDGKTLISGSNDETVRLWDLETRQPIHILTAHEKRVKCVGITPDGKMLVSASTDSKIKLWDQKTGKCERTIATSLNPATILNAISISPNREIIASGSASTQGLIKLWNLETGKRQAAIVAHNSSVLSLAFSPDGQSLASGSKSGIIKLWHLSNINEPLYIIDHAHLSDVLSLAISPDNQTLVSSGADRTIKLWNLANGDKKPPHILYGHAGRIWCVAISPDNTKIASASADYTIKIWDLHTGEQLNTLTGHLGEVRTIAFSSDGHLLASAGDDMQIRLWQAC
ncbi:CHAT domain-containing protein [Scytonema hofmannii FACHB-248]|uniref:CHAT domain-containing protein n=1 Tax=Scytonema hofmannii FACHB-248 TaxID=1842502 RepID=A0ABR8GKG9_9CYAN|nr:MULTISPECIES: CHAT domain-containing protein [Nostocales]MBD2603674.1 CHAT domain-containing protein [Scytonema hofmannii FACHB-248]